MQTICLNARVLGTFILMLSVEDLTDDLLQRKLSTTYTLSTAMEVSYKAIKSTTLVKVLKYKKEIKYCKRCCINKFFELVN